jgi:hypothetical protein
VLRRVDADFKWKEIDRRKEEKRREGGGGHLFLNLI